MADRMEDAFLVLRKELSDYKNCCEMEKQRLLVEKERALASLKELLANQADEIARFQSKVSRMKEVVAVRDSSGESDMIVRLRIVESSLFGLRAKYDEKVKILEDEKRRIMEEKENLVVGLRQVLLPAGGHSNGTKVKRIEPIDLRSEIMALRRLRDLVVSLDAQLQDSPGNSEVELSKLCDKVVLIQKEKVAAEEAFKQLQVKYDEQGKALAQEKNNLLAEKDTISMSLNEVILFLVKEAETLSSRFAALRAGLSQDDESHGGFSDMEVRLKIANRSLQGLLEQLESKKKAIGALRQKLMTSNGGTPVVDVRRGVEFRDIFSQIHKLRGVLTFLDAQLTAAGAPDAVRAGKIVMDSLKSEIAASRDAQVYLYGMIVKSKKQTLADKDSTRAFMNEALLSLKNEVGLLSAQLAAWKAKLGVSDDDDSGVTEMEVRLKLVVNGLKELDVICAETTENVAAFKNHVASEEANIPSAEHLAVGNGSSKDSFKHSNTAGAFFKLQKLRQIISVLQMQLTAAGMDGPSIPIQVLQAEKVTNAKVLDELEKRVLDEKVKTASCLKEVVLIVENLAQLERSKLNKLKGCLGFEGLESRLKFAEVAIAGLRCECEVNILKMKEEKNRVDRTTSLLETTDFSKNLAKVYDLKAEIRNISRVVAKLADLGQGGDAVNGGDETTSSTRETGTKNRNWDIMFFRVLWYATLVGGILYVVSVWDDANAFNIVCAPTWPGSRITIDSGALRPPFWAPGELKDPIFNSLCTGVPKIQLEIKDEFFVISDISASGGGAATTTTTTNAVEQHNTDNNNHHRRQAKMKDDQGAAVKAKAKERQGGFFNKGGPKKDAVDVGAVDVAKGKGDKNSGAKDDSKVRRYHAKVAYVTYKNIIASDSEGWYREIALPWTQDKKD